MENCPLFSWMYKLSLAVKGIMDIVILIPALPLAGATLENVVGKAAPKRYTSEAITALRSARLQRLIVMIYDSS